MAAEKAGPKSKPLPERLKELRERLLSILKRVRARLVKHPLCNLGLHRWQMKGWGRCTRRRCDAYRSFGRVARVKEESR